MAYTKYSLTPANNNAAPPDGAPEGMLPSAVNDTMRDMMAQIRDVGDGIRGGTYTMTAPVITGGSVTGTTFASSAATITGGSINGTTVGASTASTGAFTTLGASGVATFSAGSVSAPAITTTGDTNTGIFFPAADTIAFSEGGAEVARFNSSGNFGIGINSPESKLEVLGHADLTTVAAAGFGLRVRTPSGSASPATIQFTNNPVTAQWATIAAPAANVLAFTDGGGTERMRIDSSGNLLVGSPSSAYGKLQISTNETAGGASRFISTLSSGYGGELVQMITTQGASTSYNILSCYYGGGTAYAFNVRGDGTLFAQNTSVQSASDLRFKENIVDSSDGLNIIEALRPVRFDLKEGNGVTGKENQLGFIAQEVQAVFPEAVDVWGKSDDAENPYLSLGTGSLIPVLVKAIQELKATVDAQASRITALENPSVEN
jgi:hypothetical protein